MIYLFDSYSLDVDRQELRRGSDLVTVEPQVFDLLHYLLRNRGRVVTKDDMIAHVWHGRIVSDSTLTSRLTVARHAIGDSGADGRLIRTVARKGVRFVGEVRENEALSTDTGSIPPSPQPAAASNDAPALPDKPSIAGGIDDRS